MKEIDSRGLTPEEIIKKSYELILEAKEGETFHIIFTDETEQNFSDAGTFTRFILNNPKKRNKIKEMCIYPF